MNKFLVAFLLMTASVYSQNYELYTGTVISEDKDMHANYMIGANFIIKTNQNRKYLNNLLFGFEHSAFMSSNMRYTYGAGEEPVLVKDCNCDIENVGFDNSRDFTIKKEVRAVSLNFGVEVARRWYLITGVTNYQHIQKMNNEKVNEYRTMQIDAGVKYFIKTKHWFFSPMFKFNPETVSFGLGVSYY